MNHFAELSRRANVALGVLLIVAIIGAVTLSISLYRGAFHKTTGITLVTDRSGLMLEEGSDVKLHGVVVGRVQHISLRDNQVHMKLAMETGQALRIPSNITAAIDPTTLLGRKFVTLVPPPNEARTHLTGGEVIRTTTVTTEVNDLLTSLVSVLQEINPEKVSTTTANLSTALAGTGDQVGTLVDQLDSYLRDFNPYLPQLRDDLRLGAGVVDRLASAAPELMSTVRQASVTARTLTDNQAQFAAFVLSFSDFGQAGRDLFVRGGVPLQRAARSLNAPLNLLSEFSPIYPCFLSNLAQTNRFLERTVGGSARPGLNVASTLLMGNPPYTYPENLPKVGLSGTSPSCYASSSSPTPHIAFDDGSDAYRPIDSPDDLIGNPLATMLYGVDR
ncbi:mammalian cell entry protein [Gordonia terrae]|uniref:Mammalian cell entry protein n=1 Tax=Gordonia terrae TaxID=2055 RepID=A0A2I1R403_9ACTN|nr:MCE family protein [Gordonia terrae]PKZ63855.1 mammalian cell entry protein [Gordonia terrae]UPW10083.1 MCE family protein [Gordonia terrae]